ncbi:hypothetical protein MKZ38_007392 [Zalerion maritima]|uniref:RBR-type E3 ubiquitin transferase n=1 Tax=Zalerion maritima TaxID=339359 RepID=A0AAD5WP53_9PEZI|nr:hypothetical protein MKZ38_007392 [Zalerion maritima]
MRICAVQQIQNPGRKASTRLTSSAYFPKAQTKQSRKYLLGVRCFTYPLQIPRLVTQSLASGILPPTPISLPFLTFQPLKRSPIPGAGRPGYQSPMDLSGLDYETRILVLQLQLQDVRIQLETSSAKGKYPAGSPPDAQCALREYERELVAVLNCVGDTRMAESISGAVAADGDAIAEASQEEDIACRDRAEALRLGGGHDLPQALESIAEDLEALHISGSDDEGPTRGGRSGEEPELTVECVSCTTDTPLSRAVECPCSHSYCRECLARLFRASLTDESLYPPKCCGRQISFAENRPRLPRDLAAEFGEKRHELDATDRTYCHQRGCSAFIRKENICGRAGRATCAGCGSVTCSICKQQAHQGDCPQDPAVQQVMALARENNWQQCRSCSRLVELDHGCNHMTKYSIALTTRPRPIDRPGGEGREKKNSCRCGSQFCYICGAPWKTCPCDQWDEPRLFARANEIVDRHPLVRNLPPVQRRAMVHRERQNLAENHQCDHLGWRNRQGRHRCEECHDTLPTFIYECTQCRILACWRCRYNRL